MAKVISTAGMTAFRVLILPTVPDMVRFVRAITRVGAKVSSSKRGSQGSQPLEFIIWISPMYIAMFESWCEPLEFEFVAAEKIKVDGNLTPPESK